MDDRMNYQRATGDREGENRGITRREPQRGLSRYGAYASPFELIRRFSDDVDRMFSSMGFGGFGALSPFGSMSQARQGQGSTMSGGWSPSVDVYTKGDDLIVAADLPGLKPDDVNIEVEDNNLIISGETRQERSNRENEQQGIYYSERTYGSFYRSIPLPPNVNADNAQASFNNGVLEVTFPGAVRNLQAQRRRIQIAGQSGQPGQTAQTGQTGTTASTTTSTNPETGAGAST